MSITIERSQKTEAESWNDYVDRADGTTPFHRREALDVLAAHSGMTLHPLVGYNGAEPIGIFPVFESDSGRRTLVLSPPPVLESFQLGPAFLGLGGMKRRKVERYRAEFIAGCDEWLDAHLDPSYVHVRGSVGLDDVRPFRWTDYDATPFYTYHVDLTPDESEIMARFSSDARSNVRSPDADYDIREGDDDDLRTIISQVEQRHREQDEPYPLTPQVVRQFSDALPDGWVRPYVCEVDGRIVCGMVVLDDGETVYRWQGGVKYGGDLPAADLLDWHIMREAKDSGRERYDLVGANMRRLCQYKAKFGPEPVVYYNMKRQDPLHEFAASGLSLTSDFLEHAKELPAAVRRFRQ